MRKKISENPFYKKLTNDHLKFRFYLNFVFLLFRVGFGLETIGLILNMGRPIVFFFFLGLFLEAVLNT